MDTQAFFRISYGLYIVSSRKGDQYNGHISNTVFQVSADPALFAIATHRDNLTTEYIRSSGVFSVSVLQQNVDLQFLGPWGFKSGRDTDKFKGTEYKIGVSGAPVVLDKALAYIDCIVKEEIDTGSHILFIGEAIDAAVLSNTAPPLTYTWYRNVIKGISPEHAPTYTGHEEISETAPAGVQGPIKYKCLVCGYIYDPAEGDPGKNIPPGTPFEDLPDDWTCPVCGVGKEEFIPA